MITIAEQFRAEAEKLGIPPRTLADVTKAIRECRDAETAKSLARIMFRHGRLTDDARKYAEDYYNAH